MSKKFKYANGFEGTVSDAVAKILEGKGAGKVVGESKALSADARKKIIDAIVKAGKSTAGACDKMSDDELKALVKA